MVPRFLPYTTLHKPAFPPALIRLYLRLPWFWPLFGKQFLVIAAKRQREPAAGALRSGAVVFRDHPPPLRRRRTPSALPTLRDATD